MAVLVGKQAPDFNATAVFGNNEMKPLKLLPAGLHLRLPVRADRVRSPPR